ncbi:hypothetical protein CDL12_03512 [Handroanthus impetiginosus]|uniref:Zinc finger GRF-type domain-containing protein n=1 Tax=Handroanthus impetiginosus TaxID=429701 RepID=A0A2G9I1W2_9LAMI|nr:hypothetical protein CDL12_03512 [Handroanthus impetiginosus]
MSYSTNVSNSRSRKNKLPSLDLPYPSTPHCGCYQRTEIKVVESELKSSKGKLYNCCSNNFCNFFRWCKPERASWEHTGEPVKHDRDAILGSFLHSMMEEEDMGMNEVVFRPSPVVREKVSDNTYEIPKILFVVMLFMILLIAFLFMVVVLLLKF